MVSIGFLFATLAIIASVQSASISIDSGKAKREVTVDGRGFYLGGGSNNNLREASQLFDLGGPIANPWINAWTQPMPRTGVFPVPIGGGVIAGGVAPPPPPPPPAAAPAPAPAPAPAAPVQQAPPAQQQGYQSTYLPSYPAPLQQQAAPSYGQQIQQVSQIYHLFIN